MEGVVGFTLRGAALLALGALAGAAFPSETRSVARRALVFGLQASDRARAAGAEAMEKTLDVLAEAREEYEVMLREAEQEAGRRNLRVMRQRNGRASRRSASRPSAGSSDSGS